MNAMNLSEFAKEQKKYIAPRAKVVVLGPESVICTSNEVVGETDEQDW